MVDNSGVLMTRGGERSGEVQRDGEAHRRVGARSGFWVQADHCRSADSISRAAAVVGVTPEQYRVLLRQIARAETESVPDPDLRRLMEMGYAPAGPQPLAPLSSRHLFDDVRRWTYGMHGRYSDRTRWSADVVSYSVGVFERAGDNVDADLDRARARTIGAKCAEWTWSHLHH